MKQDWRRVLFFAVTIVIVVTIIIGLIVAFVLNKTDENIRRSILADYANNLKFQIVRDSFQNGKIPELTQDYLIKIVYQGDKVTCEEGKTDGYEVILKNCTIGNNSHKYGYIKGKIYDDCTAEEFIKAYENIK